MKSYITKPESTLGFGSNCRPHEKTLYSYRSRRQGSRGTLSLRSYQRSYRLPRALILLSSDSAFL